MTYWYLLVAALVVGAATITLWRRFSYTDHDGYIAAAIVGALITVCCLGAFAAETTDRATCLEQGEKSGIRVQYEFLSGCYVDIDGHLVPYDRWVQVTGVNSP